MIIERKIASTIEPIMRFSNLYVNPHFGFMCPLISSCNLVFLPFSIHRTKAPVFITKNGYGRLVVMDIECFEKLMEKSHEARIVNEGIKDLEEKKVMRGKDVFEEMSKKYGL